MEMLSDSGKDGKSSTTRAVALVIFGSVMVLWVASVITTLARVPEGESTWEHVGPFFTQMWPVFVAAVTLYGLNVGKELAKLRNGSSA